VTDDAGHEVNDPKNPSTSADPDVEDGRHAREMVDTDGHDGWIWAELLGEVVADPDGDEDGDAPDPSTGRTGNTPAVGGGSDAV
jgi:hypothetical protein